MDNILAVKVEFLPAIFIFMQTGWNIMQMKCKLDLAIPLSKHPETVNSHICNIYANYHMQISFSLFAYLCMINESLKSNIIWNVLCILIMLIHKKVFELPDCSY